MRKLLIAVTALLVSAPAMAQPQAGNGGAATTGRGNAPLPQTTSEGSAGAEGERRSCRQIDVNSTTRMRSRRVCMTTREWREFDRNR